MIRTIIWAVDLDDSNGTSIDYLGSGLNRTASTIYNDTTVENPGDLGSAMDSDDSTSSKKRSVGESFNFGPQVNYHPHGAHGRKGRSWWQ